MRFRYIDEEYNEINEQGNTFMFSGGEVLLTSILISVVIAVVVK